jgi:hypothetical protein
MYLFYSTSCWWFLWEGFWADTGKQENGFLYYCSQSVGWKITHSRKTSYEMNDINRFTPEFDASKIDTKLCTHLLLTEYFIVNPEKGFEVTSVENLPHGSTFKLAR